MIETTTAILSGLITSLIAAITSYLAKRRSVEERQKLSAELDQVVKERFEVGLAFGPVKVTKVIEGEQVSGPQPSPELIRSIEQQIASRVTTLPGLSKEEVRREIDQQLDEFQERLSKIESRFPEDSKLEKIASINDALLSERIDQLSKQVENLEKRVLTKWDVALTVSTIIVGIAFVVGATYTIMKYVGEVP